MKRIGGRAAPVILLLVCLAILALSWGKWGVPIKSWVAQATTSDSSRLGEAKSAYEAQDWQRAAELTRPLLKSQADNPDALRIYARASARMERDNAAASIYTGRLGASQMQAEDRFLLGLLKVRAGYLEDALEVWEKAAREGDDDPELLDNLARLSARLQRLDGAADAARRLSRKPSWEARGLLLLGEILALLDDPKGSALALRAALERDPTARGAIFPLAHYRKRLARSFLQLARPAEAREALHALGGPNEGTPGLDPEAQWLLSRAWLQEGNLKEAGVALTLAGSYRTENPLVPEPSPYSGAASCASCHRELSRKHDKSRHARTFHHAKGLLDLPFPDRPLVDPDDPKVTHNFKREDGKIKVETKGGDKIYELIVEYAFGTRDQYVTMIGRDDERAYRALRLSSYHAADGVAWGRTAGDVPDSNSSENMRGEPIRVRDGVVRCLYCHVTFYRDFRDPPPESESPAAADRAIGCERCHGPGGNHLKAIKGSFPESAIMNAGMGGAQAIGTLCADCHIVGAPGEISKAPDDPRFVRSPGLTLTFSRCFTESDGAMSCLTCHDAHRDDKGPESFYEAKCLSCHGAQAAPEKNIAAAPGVASLPATRKPVVCPVNPTTKCLDCHMPKVPLPALHRDLTDHYIRVRDRGKKN
jgi:tetratricopeptide (TPR) repeat protein